MGLKIADLLKYRGEVTLKDKSGNDILYEGNPVVVYIRLIGDQDLEDSYKIARAYSADYRAKLRDTESLEYKERVTPVFETDERQCLDIIKAARTSNVEAEARANIERPNLPELAEFSQDGDAPTLEEQEKFDAEIARIEQEYETAVLEYRQTREAIVEDELKDKPLEELRKLAALDIITVLTLPIFFNELMDQKVYRGAFVDKTYREKAFDTVEEFKNADAFIKDQLITKYLQLEVNPDEIKN